MTSLPHLPGSPDLPDPLDDPTASAAPVPDLSGTLDEALERLHAFGPERLGWLSNHAPMAVEALVRGGQAAGVHRWLDRYRHKLEDMPDRHARVTVDNWHTALGDPRRIADWADHFVRETAERPWRDVLSEWWPRLLPGIAGGATHPVIRVGHAVRSLLEDESTQGRASRSGPRVAELAHGLGYWAARHQTLPPLGTLPGARTAAAALDAVPAIDVQEGGIQERLGRLTAFPGWPAAATNDPDTARAALTQLVTAAVHRYAAHGHGQPVMLVHAATAPNAVLRALPVLPRDLWPPSLAAAWAASAAVTAAYTAPTPAPYPSAGGATPQEMFERAAAHGDNHTIKFTDTALDVGDPQALAAARRAVDLNEPIF
ncbi:questin oxidase family protein [Streptomyces uncialis]|uniref:questin oxidase family protein n=1 Tax=Streptomyces uncialis TaxID=1048205 RepID=UPI00386357CF|nr:questin oxidase family protein [Streptomyces uncialis]